MGTGFNTLKIKQGTKLLALVVGFLIFLQALSGQITTTATPSTGTIGYGDTLTISSLIISENGDKNAFGIAPSFSSIDTIILLAPSGFRFTPGESPAVTNSSTLDFNIDAAVIPPIKNDSIIVIFSTNNTNTVDDITISNIHLVPTTANTSPSGGVRVLLDTANAPPFVDTTVGPYTMVDPTLSLAYPDEHCENGPLSITAELTGTGVAATISEKDTIIFRYQLSAGDASNAVIDTFLLSTSSAQATFTLDSLRTGFSYIHISARFESGWKLEDVLSVGDNSSYDIESLEAIHLTFPKGKAISVSTFSNTIILTQTHLIYNRSDARLNITNSVPGLTGGYHYSFDPGTSGKGIYDLYCVLTNRDNNCQSLDTFRITVNPDAISVKSNYCYNEDPLDTIEVALDVLESIVGDQPTNLSSTFIEFKELEIWALDNPIQFFSQGNDVSTDNSIHRFPINTDTIIALSGVATPPSEALNFQSKLVVDLITQRGDSLKNSNINYSDVLLPNQVCKKVIHSPTYTHYHCREVWGYTETHVDLTVDREESTIHVPLNDGELLGVDSILCHVENPIRLRSNNELVSITGITAGAVFDSTGNEFYLNTDVFDSTAISSEAITINYRDVNGCLGDTIYTRVIMPVPQALFLTDSVCEGAAQQFNQTSPDSATARVVAYSWEFGDGLSLSNFSDTTRINIPAGTHDGNTAGTYKSPSHKYSSSGIKSVQIGVKTEHGCTHYETHDIVIGKFPTPNFSISGLLQDTTTTLTHTAATNASDTVQTYIYTIRAPSGRDTTFRLSNKTPLEFTPKEHGVYNVVLKASTTMGCADSVVSLLPIFQVKRLTNTDHFFDNFSDTTLNSWIYSDSYLLQNKSSWKNVPLPDSFNDGDKHTDGNIWLVGGDTLDNEIGWLESPCFDIRNLSFPMLSVDVFQSIEPQRDGAIILYSIDDGNSWIRLGDINSGGVNWYNQRGIYSNPGANFGNNPGSIGWSKDTTGWVVARHALDSIKSQLNSMNRCVRFRIAYNSNDFHNEEFQGFAIDNFLVGKRKRIVLLEEMINQPWEDKYPADKSTDLVKLDAFVGSHSDEVCDIRYHVNTHQLKDALHDINWWDNSARASEYGATAWGPMWVMDGVIQNKTDRRTLSDITYNRALERRALIDPSFEIDNIKTEVVGNSLSITSTIKKISGHIDEKLGAHDVIVRYAILQKEYIHEGQTHKNVMLDILPNGEGAVTATLKEGFAVGDSAVITELWTPKVKTVGNKFRLVIFVQGRLNYEEVQQVKFRDLKDHEVPQIATGIEDIQFASERDYIIYPNPANENVFVIPHQSGSGDINWSIYAVNGQVIKNGTFNSYDEKVIIPIDELADGYYLIQLIQSDGIRTTKRFSKTGSKY